MENNQKQSLKERIQSEAKATYHITNNDMICRDCIFRSNKSGLCEKYFPKPKSIICGGGCEFYTPETYSEE